MMGHRYTPRGTTWKPCPACGQEPKSSYKIGSICEDCAYLLDWAKHEHARYQRLSDMVVRLVPYADRISLPYCPGGSRLKDTSARYDDARRALAEAIHAMLDTLLAATGGAAEIYREIAQERAGRRIIGSGTVPQGADTPYDAESRPYPARHRAVLLRAEHAEAFDRLAPLIEIMVQASYASGLMDGKELLTQLASGAITNDQFNDADVRVAQRVQQAVTRAENAASHAARD